MSASIRPAAEYRAHLEAGRFMLQRSRSSGRYVFYPRVAEPVTGATDLEWVPASGRGTVYSTSVIRRRPPAESENVALIDLAEGPRMVSRVEGVDPGAVRIGMEVIASIVEVKGEPVVVFTPALGEREIRA